jgi:integral membrane protein (TIGR01906 family)
MKVLRIVMWVLYPIILIMMFASLLTTSPYLTLSKGLYDSHDDITYDHDYVASEIMSYLNYGRDDFLITASADDDEVIMRAIEIRHMEDVKDLYTRLRLVALGSLVVVLAIGIFMYKKDKAFLYETLKNIYWVPLMFVAFIGTWVLIDFGRLFTWFHQIFFSNDDWILRSDDALIQLLPQAFWMVSGVLILIGTVLGMGLTLYLNHKLLKPKI